MSILEIQTSLFSSQLERKLYKLRTSRENHCISNELCIRIGIIALPILSAFDVVSKFSFFMKTQVINYFHPSDEVTSFNKTQGLLIRKI
jgi:hypothetical protein